MLLFAIEIAFRQQHGGRGDTGLGPLGGLADIHQHSLAGCHLLRGFGRGELGDFRCRDGEQGGEQGGEQESGKAK